MGSALIGFAVLWGIAAVWAVLRRYALGRVLQVILTAVVYGAWLSIIPIGLYFLGEDIREALAEGRYGAAVFVGIMSVLITLCLPIPSDPLELLLPLRLAGR